MDENKRKCELISEILKTNLTDDSKILFIQSYLLHWINEEDLLKTIKANQDTINCKCGSKIELITELNHCEKCGKWYNRYGQELPDSEVHDF